MNDRQELPERTSNQPAAGWYPDPEEPGAHRYWTGAEWGPQRTNSLSGSILLAIVIPIAGLIWGIVMQSRGDRRGGTVIVVSVLLMILYFALLSVVTAR